MRNIYLAGTAAMLVMHGGFGFGAQAEFGFEMNDVAAEHGFIVVYPTGFLAWNAGDCCGWPADADIDDVGFLG